MNEEYISPYCAVCDGCGEEYCCSPVHCTQDEKGYYCKTYLADLKFGYVMYEDLAEKIYEDKERYSELIEFIDKKVSENIDLIYKK